MAALVICGLVPDPSSAQHEIQKSAPSGAISDEAGENAGRHQVRFASRTMSPDDGLSVIAAALDTGVHLRPNPDFTLTADGTQITVTGKAIAYDSTVDRAALHKMNEGMVASPTNNQ